jgi:hypothetical protein
MPPVREILPVAYAFDVKVTSEPARALPKDGALNSSSTILFPKLAAFAGQWTIHHYFEEPYALRVRLEWQGVTGTVSGKCVKFSLALGTVSKVQNRRVETGIANRSGEAFPSAPSGSIQWDFRPRDLKAALAEGTLPPSLVPFCFAADWLCSTARRGCRLAQHHYLFQRYPDRYQAAPFQRCSASNRFVSLAPSAWQTPHRPARTTAIAIDNKLPNDVRFVFSRDDPTL